MATTLTFEKAMLRLEEIVAQMESGKCSLDDSLKLFEEGTKLTAFCSGSLKSAEQKIVRLTSSDTKLNSAVEEIAGDVEEIAGDTDEQ